MSESQKPEKDAESLEDLELEEEAAEDVRGGTIDVSLQPRPPSGPIPIPYPNTEPKPKR